MIPDGIGKEKPKPQRIVLNKESFELPAIIDAEEGEDFEEIAADEDIEVEVESKPSFDLTVHNRKPKQDLLKLSEKALRALSVGQYESAIVLYKQLLQKSPKSRDGLFGLATAYHEAGERKKARVAYENLFRHHPKFEEGINNFISLASLEAPQHALEELKKLQRTSPTFPAIFAQKGLIYSKLGDQKQAIKNMAYALKLDPNDNNYKYNLAVMLDAADKPQYAARLYQELLKSSQNGEEIPIGRAKLTERLEFIIANLKK